MKYEIIEGDHWKHIQEFDNLDEALAECARLNEEANKDYFVKKVGLP